MIHRFFSAKHFESKYFFFVGCLQEQGLCNDDEACFDGKLDLCKKACHLHHFYSNASTLLSIRTYSSRLTTILGEKKSKMTLENLDSPVRRRCLRFGVGGTRE